MRPSRLRCRMEQACLLSFVAHMDTSPDADGTDVKPWVLKSIQVGM